VFELI